jgi:seryl-tRNA synthetase
MMGRAQQAQELKFELLAPIASDGEGELTAIASFNYHQDHYGRTFAIEHEGQPAHSACMGFGLERVALALLAKHGLNPASWPRSVRDELWH